MRLLKLYYNSNLMFYHKRFAHIADLKLLDRDYTNTMLIIYMNDRYESYHRIKVINYVFLV